MAELTLAAIALIFPIYDACNTMYKGCQDMRRFGVDAHLCLLRLNNYKHLLDEHMRRRMGDLVQRPDPDDTTDPTMISIIDQLTVIQTHFSNCHEIVANVMKHTDFGDVTDKPRSGSSPLPLLSAQSTLAPASGANTPLTTTRSLQSPFNGRKNKFRRSLNVFSVKNWRNKAVQLHTSSQASLGPSSSPTVESSRDSSSRDAPSIDVSSNDVQTIPREVPSVPQIVFGGEAISPLSKNDKASKRARETTGYFQLYRWADHHKKDFEHELDQLHNTIGELGEYLRLRIPEHPEEMLSLDPAVPVKDFTAPKTQLALERLHTALRKANSKPWGFSLGIYDECEEGWEQFNQYPDLKLRPGGLLFHLQWQGSLKAGESTYLAVEVMSETPGRAQENPAPPFNNFADLDLVDADDTALRDGGPYRLLGTIELSTQPVDRVDFYTEPHPWRKIKTLQDCVEDTDFLSGKDLSNLIRLSRQILIAFLNFTNVRMHCNGPRLSDFAFFEGPELEGKYPGIIDPHYPYWTQPYWSCGIGEPAKLYRMGVKNQAKDPNSAIVELGLVLYQIGSHSKAIYETLDGTPGAISWQQAKANAQRGLEMGKVDRNYGLQFSSIISICLMSGKEREIADVCSCLAKLEEMAREIDGQFRG